MSRNYARGAKRENDYGDRLEGQGWDVTRSAGSRSSKDLVACRDGHPTRYIQVKTDKAGAFAHFGPAARRELLDAASVAGARAELVWWPPDRQGPRLISAEHWPPTPDAPA